MTRANSMRATGTQRRAAGRVVRGASRAGEDTPLRRVRGVSCPHPDPSRGQVHPQARSDPARASRGPAGAERHPCGLSVRQAISSRRRPALSHPLLSAPEQRRGAAGRRGWWRRRLPPGYLPPRPAPPPPAPARVRVVFCADCPLPVISCIPNRFDSAKATSAEEG
jgi:hypothetical protein